MTEKNKVENNVLFMAFSAMYWLAKEGISNNNNSTVLKLLEKIGIHEFKYFQHRSRVPLCEVFNTLDLQSEKVKAVDFFPFVLLDDSSDVATT